MNIDGNNASLPNAFIAGGKSHLRFDGFYFANFNLFPNDRWSLLNGGEFQLYEGKHITISRCFSEGRGGYSAIPIAAYQVANLTVQNCVNTYKFGGMYFWRCPNLVIEHTVFALPMINSFVLRNEKDQPSTMSHCIFTDMLEKKAKLNIGLLCCDGAIDAFHQHNNAYFLPLLSTGEERPQRVATRSVSSEDSHPRCALRRSGICRRSRGGRPSYRQIRLRTRPHDGAGPQTRFRLLLHH